MKLAAAALVISLTVGCHSATDRVAMSTIGLLPITIGVADIAGADPDFAKGFGDRLTGGLLLTAGAIWTGVWLIEATMAHREPPPGEAPAVDVEARTAQRDEAREHAWQLTKSAAAAARTDSCITVRAIDPQVRAADADFHDTVFVRDVAIARCLAAQP